MSLSIGYLPELISRVLDFSKANSKKELTFGTD